MVRQVVFCPQPPMLVPGAAGQRDHTAIVELRRVACQTLAAATDDDPTAPVVIVGSGDHAPAGPTTCEAISERVATALLDLVGHRGPRQSQPAEQVDDAAAQVLAGHPGTVLVMADGSARRHEAAPGYLHPDAGPFDASLGRALARPDVDALADLDLASADELWVRTAPALVAAGRLGRALIDSGARLEAEVAYEGAPLGVGYWVATWSVT